VSESERKSAGAGAQARYIQTARQGQRRADRYRRYVSTFSMSQCQALLVYGVRRGPTT
jgi:hypothetical protein